MNCSGIGPFHGMKSFRNRLSLFPNEVTSPDRKPAPVWACHRITAFFQASICSGVGPSMSCRGISGLASGALPPPSLVCRAVSVTYAHFSLLGCNCCCTGNFFLFLQYFIPEALTTIVNGLDLGQGWIYWIQAKPPITVAPTHTPLLKHSHAKPMQIQRLIKFQCILAINLFRLNFISQKQAEKNYCNSGLVLFLVENLNPYYILERSNCGRKRLKEELLT